VEPIALGRYERILKTKGDNVLVGVHRVVCGGCHVKLPMQVCLHAKAQLEIASCPNCGRMLYFTPDMDV
jgi:predicted  nucleic acid-binding Zn-ribbon protein